MRKLASQGQSIASIASNSCFGQTNIMRLGVTIVSEDSGDCYKIKIEPSGLFCCYDNS